MGLQLWQENGFPRKKSIIHLINVPYHLNYCFFLFSKKHTKEFFIIITINFISTYLSKLTRTKEIYTILITKPKTDKEQAKCYIYNKTTGCFGEYKLDKWVK